MKTNWEAYNNGTRHQIDLGPNRVTISSGSGFSELGSDCTYDEFLAGTQIQQSVAIEHGPAVLAEVIAAIAEAKTHAPFVEALAREQSHRARFLAIPVDASLPSSMAAGTPSVRNGPNGTIVVRSDTVTLTLLETKGFVCANESEGPQHAFDVGGWGSTSCAAEGHDEFCVVVGGNFALVDAQGRVVRFPADAQLKLGNELRLNDCVRHAEGWIFSYWWLGVDLPRGLLRYEHGKGLTGRYHEGAS